MREIVFDTETTGLSPHDGHRLVEVGCVELVNRVETGRTWHGWFNPGRPMPAEAFQIHGLSDSFLGDKPFFPDTCDALLAFLGDAPLVAHNAEFDFAFLNWELERAGRALCCLSRMVDTQVIARRRHPGAKHSLDALCGRYGIDRSQRVKHGALIDAQLLAQLYVELTGGRQIGFLLGSDAVAAEPGPSPDVIQVTAARRPPRHHAPSVEERARHAAFVATLPDPLWAGLGMAPPTVAA